MKHNIDNILYMECAQTESFTKTECKLKKTYIKTKIKRTQYIQEGIVMQRPNNV